MSEGTTYDVAVIGGGLAGLALSIQSAKAGYKTILFEKENYPFHKVCGEYISFESWNFLESLGLPLNEMRLPVIKNLLVTAPNGKKIEQFLPLGGFGISRYKLDSMLAELAKVAGVKLLDGTKVNEIGFQNEIFNFQYSAQNVQSKIAVAAFGKRSNLDLKWKRDFVARKPNKLNNYIGVKYHVKTDWPNDLIALHNFKNGYCGISQIEDGKFCLCYLTTAKNLEDSGNSIEEMERKILYHNTHLKNIFTHSEKLYSSPVTISQISFERKSLVRDHVLFIGDAAGMITPLCGNGMSMALHASKIAFEQIDRFLKNEISRKKMEENYSRHWQKQFSRRLRMGRLIQRFFGSPFLSNLLISSLRPFPFITRQLIKQTHGKPF
jgi:menaquinone-9 beta-reductase